MFIFTRDVLIYGNYVYFRNEEYKEVFDEIFEPSYGFMTEIRGWIHKKIWRHDNITNIDHYQKLDGLKPTKAYHIRNSGWCGFVARVMNTSPKNLKNFITVYHDGYDYHIGI